MKNLFKDKADFKARSKELVKLSLPIGVEQMFIALMGVITTIMVSGIGEHAMAATALVDTLGQFLGAIFAALTIGGTIIVSQNSGRGDYAQASRVGSQAFLSSIVIGSLFCVLFLAFRYQLINLFFGRADVDVLEAAVVFAGIVAFSFPLIAGMMTLFGVIRGSGNTRTPMIITIIMNIINVGLGFILIGRFGIVGAAFALVISRALGLLLGLIYITLHSKTVQFKSLKLFIPDIAIQKMILRLGLPTSAGAATFNGGKLIKQMFVATMPTHAIAAIAIVNSMAMLTGSLGMSFSQGGMILVGQRVGRKEYDDVPKTVYFSIGACIVLLTIVCIILFPLTGVLMNLYSATPEAMVVLRPGLYLLWIMTPLFWASAFVPPSALRATGDVKYEAAVAMCSMIFVRVFLAWFIGVFLGVGVFGIWVAMYADWVTRTIFFMRRLRSGKWKKM